MTTPISKRPITLLANTVPLWILAVVAMLFFLRAAKSLMIPIALAVLISYALAPVVTWLERYRIPRLMGAALVLLVVLGASVSGAYALRDDAWELVDQLPKALQRGREAILSQLGSGDKAIQEATRGAQASKQESGGTRGEQVTGTVGQMSSSLVQRMVGAVFAFAGHLVVIFFLIYFLLISGHHVRNRLVEIAGSDAERQRTTLTIIDDINTQIQRYLLVLLVTAVIVCAFTWGVLAWMGVRHAAMWGILAGVFNSIPYFGPVIVSGGLFVVGMLQGGGMTQALQMSGASIVITSLEGWLLTPLLMGKAERMSALAVFLGLLLWTWVWGAWGTVLAVPMLVVIKSVADHVDTLKPLGRLMAP
jgi:predicted PurR-regulated permease PerM